jgi:acyl-CoA thioester hydrolase
MLPLVYVHEFKNEEDKLCAIITVDGAWMDTTRKSQSTPAIAVEAMSSIPKTILSNFRLLKF